MPPATSCRRSRRFRSSTSMSMRPASLTPRVLPYRRLLGWHRFYESSEDVPLAFRPVDGVTVIDKNVYTCVTPAFLDELRSKGIGEVAICGIDTDACVATCAVDLFENGFRPILLSEACASHAGAEYHEAAIRILTRLIGKKQIV